MSQRGAASCLYIAAPQTKDAKRGPKPGTASCLYTAALPGDAN